MTKQRDKQPSQPRTATQLLDEDCRLEGQFADISRRATTGDCRESDVVWNDFARQLEAHLEFEEREIFPRYEPLGPTEASTVKALRTEHATIREKLAELGMDLQLHLDRAEMIDAFLTSLRIHARYEQDSIYPWLAATDALVQQRTAANRELTEDRRSLSEAPARGQS